MIYKKTETYKYDDADDDVWTYLVNINPEDAVDYAEDAGHLIMHFEPVKFEDVNTEQLISMIQTELEGENRHSLMDIPTIIRERAEDLFGYVGAKQLLWNIINMHGASLGL